MTYQASKSATGKRSIGTEVGALQVDPGWYDGYWFSERPASSPGILRRTVARLQSGWSEARQRYPSRRVVREDETLIVIDTHV
jgi:hypothetical protein